MRLRYLVVPLVMLCLAPAWGAPLVTAYRTPTAPVLDGKLDDACWQAASVCGPFLPADGSALDARSQAYVCWDAEHLYVAFECFDRYLEPALQQMDRVRATVRDHDGNVFGDDCVELFLELAGGRWQQFAANSLGVRYEGRNGDPSWDCDWQAAAHRGSDRYVVELRVPFTALDLKPAAGLELGANFCRERQAVEEYSTWSGLRGAFNQTGLWGRLRLADSGPALRQSSFAGTVTTRRVLVGEAVGTGAAPLTLELALAADKPLRTYRAPFSGSGPRLTARQEIDVPAEALQARKLSYTVALKAGDDTLYRSATCTETLGASQAELKITAAPGVKWQVWQDGQPLAGAEVPLHSGLNWLTIAAEGTAGWLRPELRVGGEALSGTWFVTDQQPGEGW